VIEQLKRLAKESNLTTVVVTFDHHPASVVRPELAPLLLTDTEQKLEQLDRAGVDRAVVLPFDDERASESAEDFVDEVLVRLLDAKVVVVGADFHFGHRRTGNVDLLRNKGLDRGFAVYGVNLDAGENGEVVSSTRIREALGAGDVGLAAAMLGRSFELRGVVVHGDGRGGAELGIPTANFEFAPGMAVPGTGVYAGVYRGAQGKAWPAAINIGNRPVFYGQGGSVVCEAHLVGFDGDLYGERASLTFVRRLRDDQVFTSVEDLVVQIRRDIDATRETIDLRGLERPPEIWSVPHDQS
jgi:riboflavin kinase/FMN adenylyltransferase